MRLFERRLYLRRMLSQLYVNLNVNHAPVVKYHTKCIRLYYVNLEVLFLKYYFFIVIRIFYCIITFSRESIME